MTTTRVFRSLTAIVTLTTLLWTSPVTSQTSYDAGLLEDYIRLSQQIRNEMYQLSDSMYTRLAAVTTQKASAESLLRSMMNEGNALLSGPSNRLQGLGNRAKMYHGSAVQAKAQSPYRQYDLIYTDLVLDYGSGYSGPTTSMKITTSGVYQVTVQGMAVDNYSSAIGWTVVGADDEIIYDVPDFPFGVSGPGYWPQLYELEAGSVIYLKDVRSPYPWGGSYDYSRYLVTGIASQMNIRYMGALP